MEEQQPVREISRGWGRFLANYLPLFSASMLGLVAIRIWLQACVYDRYTSTDSGIETIVANLFRVLIILVLIAVVIKRGFSQKAQNRLGYVSILVMMAAAVLFLIYAEVGSHEILWGACLCAGFGIAWGGGMWICAYVRMPPGEALLYAFLSLGISSVVGFVLGVVPAWFSYLVAILAPPISLVAYQRAQNILDAREVEAALVTPDPEIHEDASTVYDTEPKATFIRLIVGMMLFNLALGIARGFPNGESIALPVPFQAIHQFGVLILSGLLIWWALVRKYPIRFSSLWNISVAFIAVGVLLLAVLDSMLTPWGAMIISLANTFSVGLLWFSIYDVSRHTSWPPYAVLGVAWAAHLLPRELGRFAIWMADPHTFTVLLTAFIVFILAGSMVFLLNDSIPKNRPLFATFRRKANEGYFRSHVVQIAEGERVADASGESPPSLEVPTDQPLVTEVQEPVRDSLEIALEATRKRYHLTDREMEVVAFIAQGRSKTYIGKKLFISENTVKTYVKNIYTKLDVHSKQELLDEIDACAAAALEEK